MENSINCMKTINVREKIIVRMRSLIAEIKNNN